MLKVMIFLLGEKKKKAFFHSITESHRKTGKQQQQQQQTNRKSRPQNSFLRIQFSAGRWVYYFVIRNYSVLLTSWKKKITFNLNKHHVK